MPYTIHPLHEKPELADACAAWSHGRWGVEENCRDFTQSMIPFAAAAIDNGQLPFTVIATDENGLPVGMASLWEDDDSTRPHISPWVASVFIHEKHRNQGLGRQLISAIEDVARENGFTEVHLKTSTTKNFYPLLGYTAKEVDQPKTPLDNEQTLYQKTL